MGLKLSTDQKGITYPDAYYKIKEYKFSEERTVDGVKYYKAILNVVAYTDSTKEYELDVVSMPMPREDFVEADNTLSSMYTWMKTLPMFGNATDA